MNSSACMSPCGLYRYTLWRTWEPEKPTMAFVMLNPSTANAHMDDPTIRRCIGFAKREDCGALKVVNLFAFRATNPDTLLVANDPVGPGADYEFRHLAEDIKGQIVAAWGSHKIAKKRASEVIAMLGDRLMCLGTTKDGSPKHPLYLPKDAPLQPYRV